MAAAVNLVGDSFGIVLSLFEKQRFLLVPNLSPRADSARGDVVRMF
jgi:hypothetical protein